MRHEMNNAELNALLHSPRGGVAKELYRRGRKVQLSAKRLCPVDHGRLRNSIDVAMITIAGITHVEVGTDVTYALWVHNGTGLYGPRKARIHPVHAKALVFTPRKGGGKLIPARQRGVVIVRSTRGMRGTPFLRDALPSFR